MGNHSHVRPMLLSNCHQWANSKPLHHYGYRLSGSSSRVRRTRTTTFYPHPSSLIPDSRVYLNTVGGKARTSGRSELKVLANRRTTSGTRRATFAAAASTAELQKGNITAKDASCSVSSNPWVGDRRLLKLRLKLYSPTP